MNGSGETLVKNVITIVQRTMFVNRKNAQLVDVIRMLIGLTDIFANHTRQKVRNRQMAKRDFIHKDNFWVDLQVQTPISIAMERNTITEQEIVKPYLGQIRTEIDRQQKWLLQAGYTAYNVDIALDAIKAVVAEGSNKE